MAGRNLPRFDPASGVTIDAAGELRIVEETPSSNCWSSARRDGVSDLLFALQTCHRRHDLLAVGHPTGHAACLLRVQLPRRYQRSQRRPSGGDDASNGVVSYDGFLRRGKVQSLRCDRRSCCASGYSPGRNDEKEGELLRKRRYQLDRGRRLSTHGDESIRLVPFRRTVAAPARQSRTPLRVVVR